MSNQIFAAETLARTLACDESVDCVVDDISSRLGQNGNSHNLKLERLSYITIKRGEKVILRVFGPDIFNLPPTEICHLVKELLDNFLYNIQFHDNRDLEISAKPGFSFKNISTGFETVWEIRVEDIVFGKIYERGSFYDRTTNIEIDCSSLE